RASAARQARAGSPCGGRSGPGACPAPAGPASATDGSRRLSGRTSGGLGRGGSDHKVPRVCAQRADVSVQTSASPAELADQLGTCAFQPQPLGGPVTGINEVRRATASLFTRLERRVMAQVGGDVDVGSAGPDGVEP